MTCCKIFGIACEGGCRRSTWILASTTQLMTLACICLPLTLILMPTAFHTIATIRTFNTSTHNPGSVTQSTSKCGRYPTWDVRMPACWSCSSGSLSQSCKHPCKHVLGQDCTAQEWIKTTYKQQNLTSRPPQAWPQTQQRSMQIYRKEHRWWEWPARQKVETIVHVCIVCCYGYAGTCAPTT